MRTQQNIKAIIRDRKGRILSIGQNSYVKTHPLQAKFAKEHGEPKKIFLHAEIHAIVRCKNLDKAHSITVIRTDANGKYLLAKPCKICQDAIRSSGIKEIFHT